MEINLVLRGAIAEKQRTTIEIAEAIGISRQNLSKKLNGHLPFTYDELVKASAELGLPMIELVRRAQQLEVA